VSVQRVFDAGFQDPGAIVIECLTMTKRRLNQQQRRRITEQQQTYDPASSMDGLVVCHYGQQLDVESLDSAHQGQIFRCFQRSNLPALVTGDRVLWRPETENAAENRGVIVAQKPRHAVMSRPNNRGELRAIAANVDCVAVVIAPQPEPFGNLIDRYLVAIEHLDLRPVILLNKADLLDTNNKVAALLERYKRIGYETLRVSSKAGDGMDGLKEALKGQTAVFVGQSGVGKSSLINTLRGVSADDEEFAEVGALSVAQAKGTHTTTATRLYHLPGSGDLIDSPGIREFGLWHISADELTAGFREFRPYAGQCRFRDCRHQHEPDCALRAAAAKGEIDPARLESYHYILTSLEEQG